jgi:hypothetical protein
MTTTPDFKTLDEEVEFWESHDSSEYWDEMEEAEFAVDFHHNLLYPRLVFLTEQPARCPRCHNDLVSAAIQYVTWSNGHLVVIRDVPIFRCRVNGHEYMLENTLDQVEELLKLEKAKMLRPTDTIPVPVFKLKMAG